MSPDDSRPSRTTIRQSTPRPSPVSAAAAVASEAQASVVRLPEGVLSVKEHHRELRQKVVDRLPRGGIVYMEVCCCHPVQHAFVRSAPHPCWSYISRPDCSHRAPYPQCLRAPANRSCRYTHSSCNGAAGMIRLLRTAVLIKLTRICCVVQGGDLIPRNGADVFYDFRLVLTIQRLRLRGVASSLAAETNAHHRLIFGYASCARTGPTATSSTSRAAMSRDSQQ